jgi:hypothetical protein
MALDSCPSSEVPLTVIVSVKSTALPCVVTWPTH